MRAHLLAGLLVAAALPAAAAAQARPSEEELFGAPAQPQEPATPGAQTPPDAAAPQAPAGTAPRPSEQEIFGAQGSPNAVAPPPEGIIGKAREKEDALKIGGQLYLRLATTALEEQGIADWRLSSPNLLDVYLDARPNDRVRAFALGRVFYDPTFVQALPTGELPSGATLASSGTLPIGTSTTANPSGVLDQLWINFDVAHTAFVTAGRQHAKWGVGHFWNPTDYLHPVRRDPLAVFDQRTGTTMVKVHVPWEQRGWNFYGVTVFEDVAGDPPRRADGTADSNRLGRVGVGGRAEVVLGGVELGADALVQDRHRPRFGVDFSTGLWDLDVYGEAALRTTLDTPHWRCRPGADCGSTFSYERHDAVGFTPQITAGASYSVKYSDEDAVTVGGEYFFNDGGYANARIYPVLLAAAATSTTPTFDGSVLGTTGTVQNPFAGQANPFTPFYLGRHYAGAYVQLPNPGSWNNTTFTLSVLGNLSDKSFIARLDHSVLVLTYLRVETYVAGHFGDRAGEFRLGLDLRPDLPIFTPPQVFDAGIALRVSL
jgi:hypothetical protein